MSGKAPYEAGRRFENETVEWLDSLGLEDVKRVPLSGGVQGFADDVLFRVPGSTRLHRVQCKYGELAMKTLKAAIGGADVLVTREKRSKEKWVLMRGEYLETLVRLITEGTDETYDDAEMAKLLVAVKKKV